MRKETVWTRLATLMELYSSSQHDAEVDKITVRASIIGYHVDRELSLSSGGRIGRMNIRIVSSFVPWSYALPCAKLAFRTSW